MAYFKFELKQRVKLTITDEAGEIKGRAEYTNCENSYYLHYKCADGRAVNAWFDESLLTDATPCGN